MSEKRTAATAAGPDLSDFLVSGLAVEEISELAGMVRARDLIGSFITLFRGSEAEVLLRLLVLREIGKDADSTRWAPEALRARFAYLDPIKLETVLKRLRDNSLLTFADDGHYHLSDIGRNAVAAISMLLQFADEEDAELGFLTAQLAGLSAVGSVSAEALGHLLSKLNDLSWHFEEAIASGSEFNIVAARKRLSANEKWLQRGTELLNTLLADPGVDFDIARIAQRIGLAQSRLARVDASFQRALNKIEAQRVTLGASGISSSDVTAWLRTLSLQQLFAQAADALAAVPDVPLLAGGHELLDRAEAALCEPLRGGEAPQLLPPAHSAAAHTHLPVEDLALLKHFNERLAELNQPQSLASVVSGGGFAVAAYRLSLLALLAEGADIDAPSGPVGDFMRLPLQVRFDANFERVDDPEIALISAGSVSQLEPVKTSATGVG